MMTAATSGFLLGLSLILAIGAQNAFVLRQGLRGQHVLAVVLVCAASDAALIAFGVGGFGMIAQVAPWFAPLMAYGGAAFLLGYGALAFRSAWRGGGALLAADQGAQSRWAAVATCLALTWLNPHVYLDTVVLLGSVSTQFPGQTLWFGLGAGAASFIFFFSLGYGAALLRPLFARPGSWRILDCVVGGIMWMIALKLLFL